MVVSFVTVMGYVFNGAVVRVCIFLSWIKLWTVVLQVQTENTADPVMVIIVARVTQQLPTNGKTRPDTNVHRVNDTWSPVEHVFLRR